VPLSRRRSHSLVKIRCRRRSAVKRTRVPTAAHVERVRHRQPMCPINVNVRWAASDDTANIVSRQRTGRLSGRVHDWPVRSIDVPCHLVDPCRSADVCSRGHCRSFAENGSFACQCRSDTCSSPLATCDSSKITTLTCKCPTNQYGEQCEYTCPCENAGRCIVQENNVTVLCQCDESRFYGDRCEHVSPCASQPCYMGGTCVRNASRFICQCPADRIGSQCVLPHQR
jgi:hypothetical protein